MKNEYVGAIHIHSTCSDGTADIEEISLVAKKAGLAWIIVTDHNNMDIEEGFYNGVCVIKGEEISPEKNNHYLGLDISKTISSSLTPDEFIGEVHKQGGFGFVAHPDESKNRKNSYPPIYWEDKTLTPDGIEIWNWFSTWADNYCDKNIFHIAYSYLFRHKLVKKANIESLKWWDELNNNSKKIVPAICGIDAHALNIKKLGIYFKIFPYKSMFKTLANVVFTDEPLANNFEVQKQQILKSIKLGKNLIINRHISDKIPEITIENKNTIAQVGSTIKLDESTFLNVNFPKKIRIKVFYNGKEVYNEAGKNLKYKINKVGKYRVELFKKNYGFAYSNPIIVTE